MSGFFKRHLDPRIFQGSLFWLLVVLFIAAPICARADFMVFGSVLILLIYIGFAIALNMLNSDQATGTAAFSPFLVTILGGVFLLLWVATIFQAYQAYRERLFSKQISLISQQPHLLVTYPEKLLQSPSDQRGMPLTLALAPTATAPQTTPVLAVTPSITNAASLAAAPAAASPTPTASLPSAYTVQIISDPPLIFADSEGKAVPPRVDLYVDPSKGSQQTLYVRPPLALGQDIRPTFLIAPANTTATPASFTESITINIEDSLEMGTRLLMTQLLGDVAIPLGIAVAASGWIIDANKQRQAKEERAKEERDKLLLEEKRIREEREEKEQKERVRTQEEQQKRRNEEEIQRAEDLYNSVPGNLADSISSYHVLCKELHFNPAKDRLAEVKKLLDLRKTKSDAEHLVLEAGNHLRNGQRHMAINILQAVILHFDNYEGGDLRRNAETLCMLLGRKKVDISLTVEAIRYLRSEYSAVHRELCVHTLLELYSYLKMTDEKNQCKAFYYTVDKKLHDMWTLLRDQRLLDAMPQAEDLADLRKKLLLTDQGELVPQRFIHSIRKKRPVTTISNLQKWLNQWSLVNIFEREFFDEEQEQRFRKVFSQSLGLDLTEVKHQIIEIDSDLARIELAGNLYRQCLHPDSKRDAREPKRAGFPVELPLSTNLQLVATPNTLLRQIAQAASDRWVRLLLRQPQLFYDLNDTDRAAMGQLLALRFGSYEIFRVLMEFGSTTKPSQEHDGQQNKQDLKVTDDISSSVTPQPLPAPDPHSSIDTMADRQALLRDLEPFFKRSDRRNLSDEEMLGWLYLRPRAIEYTFLIVECLDQLPATAAQTMLLFQLSSKLEEANIFIKAFLPTEFMRLHPELNEFLVRWSDEQLIDALGFLIRGPNTGIEDFIDAIDASVLSADQRRQLLRELASRADGSLDGFLDLLRKVIEKRISRSLQNPLATSILGPEDFNV